MIIGPDLPFYHITKYFIIQVNLTVIFLTGGQQNGTWTKQTWMLSTLVFPSNWRSAKWNLDQANLDGMLSK